MHEVPTAIDQTLEGVTRVSTLVSAMKGVLASGDEGEEFLWI